ncbi:urea ABC transporter permease subunit UrtB [Pseudovibrio exalbescens]|uniref:urea ABC transporter permease subunit UrtB n=1 Tax=Pseudovibrio exalbescens TaxID=197461 RepID=UPI0023653C69|nr:urea ABC transporter permease subunit UrtB [Pseudovibrio exalbescens]MDD7911689.1 urea ABC transporter permease subunit UrtB [Pseudovibrio exalbescens]
MRQLRKLAVAVLLSFLAAVASTGHGKASDTSLEATISALASAKLKDRGNHIEALAATGDAQVVPFLEALAAGDVYFKKSDKTVFITRKAEGGLQLLDPLSLEEGEVVGSRSLKKVKVNNKLRRLVRGAVAGLTVQSHDAGTRLEAANALYKSQDLEALPLLKAAVAAETDETVKDAQERAIAAITLKNVKASEAERLEALGKFKAQGDQEALALVSSFLPQAKTAAESEAAALAIQSIEKSLAMWDAVENVWYGLSLGSVLLLAAIGLAITFGVMGVINMAHGEMVMLGAYTTFVVQEVIRKSFPGFFEFSLLFALPLAFLVAGGVGLAMERGIIRFLYGRPLETLLATWGVSLILQQAVRTIFGPTNKEVGNPDWMSGAFEIGGLALTANRLWILVFALVVFVVLLMVLKRTHFGLQMRAVTQNRRMAASMGIRTPWVDARTFALGSGIAGMAGVALSQISNVSPNLGQTYIIDSFMVVVFGGVGNLWGTLVGAMTLGVANKFLEPYAGAVLAKILVLVFIILFIQKKPRGLFALKGRAVDL